MYPMVFQRNILMKALAIINGHEKSIGPLLMEIFTHFFIEYTWAWVIKF